MDDSYHLNLSHDFWSLFDIKLDMLEAIEGVANHAKSYNWANYLVDLVKIICEKC